MRDGFSDASIYKPWKLEIYVVSNIFPCVFFLLIPRYHGGCTEQLHVTVTLVLVWAPATNRSTALMVVFKVDLQNKMWQDDVRSTKIGGYITRGTLPIPF
jgi:hypothetical protein